MNNKKKNNKVKSKPLELRSRVKSYNKFYVIKFYNIKYSNNIRIFE
jgi:hypothetical protein